MLCLVTAGGGDDLVARVAGAVAGGVDWVQVRERSLEGAALLALVEAIGQAAPEARVLVNRRLDVALAAGAQGAHLGFDAPPPEEARRLLGADALLGASIHAPEELDALGEAARGALGYVHLAPIYPPISKPPERPALGVAALTAAARRGVPVLAQGGINAARARACLEAGAVGVAVTGEILAADDAARAAAGLREALGH